MFAIKLEFGKCDVLRPESLTDTWGSHLLDLRNSSSKTWIPESSSTAFSNKRIIQLLLPLCVALSPINSTDSSPANQGVFVEPYQSSDDIFK